MNAKILQSYQSSTYQVSLTVNVGCNDYVITWPSKFITHGPSSALQSDVMMQRGMKTMTSRGEGRGRGGFGLWIDC